jgi:hypothetical protein
MVRNVFRRLERLETRAAATRRDTLVIRILLVDPVKGCTGVIVMETGKPDLHVDPTPEEVERVRAGMEQRRAAWKGGATDTDDCAPA